MYDLYDLDSIELPRRQIPPAGMPLPAWSNSGELFTYGDVHDIANKTGLEPNQVGATASGGTCQRWKRGPPKARPIMACNHTALNHKKQTDSLNATIDPSGKQSQRTSSGLLCRLLSHGLATRTRS